MHALGCQFYGQLNFEFNCMVRISNACYRLVYLTYDCSTNSRVCVDEKHPVAFFPILRKSSERCEHINFVYYTYVYNSDAWTYKKVSWKLGRVFAWQLSVCHHDVER